MAEPPNFWQRLMHRHAPTPGGGAGKPLAEAVRRSGSAHSELWRFTRRSVPRAVFAGLFIGIFLMVPGLQIVGAALLCVPMRANIPIAAAMTFLSNPLTTPFFLYAAIDVGGRIGFHTDLASFVALRGRERSANGCAGCCPMRRRRWSRACS